MNTNSKSRNLVINALLLGIGAILHQITPALGLPMQPDFALAMLIIIIIINKSDYKTTLVASIITGIFTALTTKFPGGQIPNIIDKIVTGNIIFFVTLTINEFNLKRKINLKTTKRIISAIVFPIGTIISGTVFLLVAQITVGLPGGASFKLLFLTVVIPAVIINTIVGFVLNEIIEVSLKRISIN